MTWVLACWLAIGAMACAGPQGAAQVDTVAKIERGRVVYRDLRCQACHAIAGVGNRRYPLDGVGTKLSADAIRKWIVAPQEMNPKVRKPAHTKLPPNDLDALVAYLRSLPKAK